MLPRSRVVLALATVVAAAAFLYLQGDPWSEFCGVDALLTETPPGWEFDQDHANNCEWTLFDENGNRAPVELYEVTSREHPPSIPFNWYRVVDWVGVAASVGGLVTALLSVRSSERVNEP